jgi:glycosyltransferase involved in cell wall biosynthesis
VFSLKEAVRPYYLRWLYFPLRPRRYPQAFQDCWRYPYQRIRDDGARLPSPPSDLPDLLFYPMTDFHNRVQRTQHLVRAFAGLGFRCVYLNPHLGREFETTRLFDKAHRLAELGKNIFELHIRLPHEPVFHDRILTSREEDTIRSAIRAILPGGASALQILSFPLWTGVARRFREESSFPIVYDCHDLLSGFQNISPEIIQSEAALLEEADLVLFSSQGLADRFQRQVRRSLLVRNGVTATEFQTQPWPVQAAGPIARPCASRPPAAGYVGALDSWFDVEAVRAAARQNPQCRFLIAGRPEYAPVRSLSALSNVELLGEVPYRQVPEFLSRLRVALIPFTITPLTLMTNPIKLYEYFSLGLPVVSSPLPEAQAMGDLVYIGTSPADFARQVTRALEEEDPSRRARRRDVAAQENWHARACAVSAEFPVLVQR